MRKALNAMNIPRLRKNQAEVGDQQPPEHVLSRHAALNRAAEPAAVGTSPLQGVRRASTDYGYDPYDEDVSERTGYLDEERDVDEDDDPYNDDESYEDELYDEEDAGYGERTGDDGEDTYTEFTGYGDEGEEEDGVYSDETGYDDGYTEQTGYDYEDDAYTEQTGYDDDAYSEGTVTGYGDEYSEGTGYDEGDVTGYEYDDDTTDDVRIGHGSLPDGNSHRAFDPSLQSLEESEVDETERYPSTYEDYDDDYMYDDEPVDRDLEEPEEYGDEYASDFTETLSDEMPSPNASALSLSRTGDPGSPSSAGVRPGASDVGALATGAGTGTAAAAAAAPTKAARSMDGREAPAHVTHGGQRKGIFLHSLRRKQEPGQEPAPQPKMSLLRRLPILGQKRKTTMDRQEQTSLRRSISQRRDNARDLRQDAQAAIMGNVSHWMPDARPAPPIDGFNVAPPIGGGARVLGADQAPAHRPGAPTGPAGPSGMRVMNPDSLPVQQRAANPPLASNDRRAMPAVAAPGRPLQPRPPTNPRYGPDSHPGRAPMQSTNAPVRASAAAATHNDLAESEPSDSYMGTTTEAYSDQASSTLTERPGLYGDDSFRTESDVERETEIDTDTEREPSVGAPFTASAGTAASVATPARATASPEFRTPGPFRVMPHMTSASSRYAQVTPQYRNMAAVSPHMLSPTLSSRGIPVSHGPAGAAGVGAGSAALARSPASVSDVFVDTSMMGSVPTSPAMSRQLLPMRRAQGGVGDASTIDSTLPDSQTDTRSGSVANALYSRATSSRPHNAVLRDETSGRVPQLVDPFADGNALDRFSREIRRPESIEPSLFDGEAASGGQPSSPLMPRTGPLSGQRDSDSSSTMPAVPTMAELKTPKQHKPTDSTTSSDFFTVRNASIRSGTPMPGLRAARRSAHRVTRTGTGNRGSPARARGSARTHTSHGVSPERRSAHKSRSKAKDVPPVPPVPPVLPTPKASPTPNRTHRKKHEAPMSFRNLENKAPKGRTGSKQRTPRALRDPSKYLLTPSVAPTETDSEEQAELSGSKAKKQPPASRRPWLLRDLSAEETHYFLREMISKELTWEWDRLFVMRSFDRPMDSDQLQPRKAGRRPARSDSDSRAGDFSDSSSAAALGLTDDEDVFRRDVYDPHPPPLDLPLLRFLLRNAFCTFPLFVPPEQSKNGPRMPNKSAVARMYFFSAIMPIAREIQARSLSATVDRLGESDGMPFMGQSFTSSIMQLIKKWSTRYITAVLRVGPGSPYYGAEQVHNRSLPWPNAKLLPPEAFVCYRRPTDRLRFGGFEVDIVAVREHSHRERDFLLRIRRPNRMDEFVVRNDRDWDEFRAKLAHELGPFVHVRPLPRLPGRIELEKQAMDASDDTRSADSESYYTRASSYAKGNAESGSVSGSGSFFESGSGSGSGSGTSYADSASYYTDSSEHPASLSPSRPPPGMTAADILKPLYGPRSHSMPRFEVDRRLLRSWLRDTLAIRSIADSSEVRAFLSIGCFNDRELDTNELLNIAERRRVDCRRIEEREKDAEMAGESVLSIRRVQQRIWVDCVDGDGFLKMFDALKATSSYANLPSSYQMMWAWGNLQAARFLYGIFVQGDQSRANLARARDMIDAIPWRKLANAMRLPAVQMVAEWQKQFLRNRFFHALFQIVFEDNPVIMDEDLRALQQAIESDTMVRKLRMYVESPEDFKRLVRQHAVKAGIPLVAAIVRGSDAPKLSKTDVQRVIAASREYTDFMNSHPTAIRKKGNTSPGFTLIVNLQRVLRLYSLHRDVTQIRGMLQDPTILDALTVLLEPLLEALVRLHRVKGIREDLMNLHVFLLRLFDLLESLRARVQDPARSINTLASFLDRSAPGLYDFLHRWSHVDPTVFSTFAWFRHLAMSVGVGSEDLASIWDPPSSVMHETDPSVEEVTTALRSTNLDKFNSLNVDVLSNHTHLDPNIKAEIVALVEAARRKRGRQMEIASRWAAGDTEADFSIQVFGDGDGHMRREPFLPKEPAPAPRTELVDRLLRSFREAVSSALNR